MHTGASLHNFRRVMPETAERPRLTAPSLERLTVGDHFKGVMWGIGATVGLGLLWALEIARDGYFRLLDRMNVKPRRRRASAFPPGRPRRRQKVS